MGIILVSLIDLWAAAVIIHFSDARICPSDWITIQKGIFCPWVSLRVKVILLGEEQKLHFFTKERKQTSKKAITLTETKIRTTVVTTDPGKNVLWLARDLLFPGPSGSKFGDLWETGAYVAANQSWFKPCYTVVNIPDFSIRLHPIGDKPSLHHQTNKLKQSTNKQKGRRWGGGGGGGGRRRKPSGWRKVCLRRRLRFIKSRNHTALSLQNTKRGKASNDIAWHKISDTKISSYNTNHLGSVRIFFLGGGGGRGRGADERGRRRGGGKLKDVVSWGWYTHKLRQSKCDWFARSVCIGTSLQQVSRYTSELAHLPPPRPPPPPPPAHTHTYPPPPPPRKR